MSWLPDEETGLLIIQRFVTSPPGGFASARHAELALFTDFEYYFGLEYIH